jgi:predicted ATPase
MSLAEVAKIREQFKEGLWPQFLDRIEIAGLRGWSGQSVQFRFPVTAIVGENGTGKSTILKVAASAYAPLRHGIGYFPSNFFPTTHWDDISSVTLGYRIRLGDDLKSFSIKKPTQRWSFPDRRYERPVFWFDVARTLPLDASAGYARIAKLATGETASEELTDESRLQLSTILGRDYSSARFASPDVNANRKVGLLGREFGEVSQFHQGAGEDTTLDLVLALQDIPQNSLIIIDEVEASLHPRAQRRLIRSLLNFSRLRRVQVIVSTHSPYILEELPAEARVLVLPSSSGPSVIYGASPEFALSRIDDAIHPEAYIYVEDAEASRWLREIIATHPDGAELLTRTRICPVGPANVVRILGDLACKGKLPHRAISVLDGDCSPSPGCITMPGDSAPERVVFLDLKNAGWPNLSERFGIGAGSLLQYLEDVVLTPDHHLWTTRIGDRIVKSAGSVWETMCTEWCRECLDADARDSLVTRISSLVEQ